MTKFIRVKEEEKNSMTRLHYFLKQFTYSKFNIYKKINVMKKTCYKGGDSQSRGLRR